MRNHISKTNKINKAEKSRAWPRESQIESKRDYHLALCFDSYGHLPGFEERLWRNAHLSGSRAASSLVSGIYDFLVSRISTTFIDECF